jgi:hypothetical protein
VGQRRAAPGELLDLFEFEADALDHRRLRFGFCPGLSLGFRLELR